MKKLNIKVKKYVEREEHDGDRRKKLKPLPKEKYKQRPYVDEEE